MNVSCCRIYNDSSERTTERKGSTEIHANAHISSLGGSSRCKVRDDERGGVDEGANYQKEGSKSDLSCPHGHVRLSPFCKLSFMSMGAH